MIIAIEAVTITDIVSNQTDEGTSFFVREGYFSPDRGRQQITTTLELLGSADERLAVLKKWASEAGYRLIEAGEAPVVESFSAAFHDYDVDDDLLQVVL